MPRSVRLSDRTYALLENIRRALEVRGRRMSHDDIVREALELYRRMRMAGEEEVLLRIWERLDELERRIAVLEGIAGVSPRPVVQPSLREVAAREEREPDRKFLEFMKDVVIYPLERIRKPRSSIEKLRKQGLLEVIEAHGQAYLVYKPKLDMFMARLPLPLNKLSELSDRERQLVEVLKAAGMVFEDARSRTLRRV